MPARNYQESTAELREKVDMPRVSAETMCGPSAMNHRIEPEESWWLAPWRHKKTGEKVLILLGLVFCVWQTIEGYERGYVINWFTTPVYWLSLGWAYFSESGSREIIVITELGLNGSRSAHAEPRSPELT